jgi:hypothetical protein
VQRLLVGEDLAGEGVHRRVLVEQRDDGVGVPGVERVLVREREAGRVDDPGIGAFLGVHG